MKKYIKPNSELIPADAQILSDSTNPGTISIIDGPVIEDGSEILSPRINLWEDEEDEGY